MKTNLRIGTIVVLLGLSACADDLTPQETYEPGQPVSHQVFYNQLSPYGTWVDYPTYGYVWVPNVAWGFSPYATNGYWVYTSYGWTWYSYYSWGWAPFHYGRWFFDVGYGWLWIPDTVWGPAWVAWRNGGGYCGWAPLGPSISVNIVISGGHTIPHDHWVFVRDRDFPDKHIDRHRVDRSQNISLVDRAPLMRNVREERNTVFLPGPERDEIQRVTQRPVSQMKIVESNRPGSNKIKNDQLEIFRPPIDKEVGDRSKHTPERVFGLDEINKSSETKTLKRQGQLKTPTDTYRQVRPSQQPKIQSRPPVRENKSIPNNRTVSPPKSNPPKATPRKRNN